VDAAPAPAAPAAAAAAAATPSAADATGPVAEAAFGSKPGWYSIGAGYWKVLVSFSRGCWADIASFSENSTWTRPWTACLVDLDPCPMWM
jgi:hypothetical protein